MKPFKVNAPSPLVMVTITDLLQTLPNPREHHINTKVGLLIDQQKNKW